MTQTERALSSPVLSIRRWLRRRIAILIGIRILSTAISFGLEIVILIGTFYFAYAVIWLGCNQGISSISELLFGKRLHLSHNMILVLCGCFIGLLFFENAFVERDYWSQYSANRSQWSGLWMAGVTGSLAAKAYRRSMKKWHPDVFRGKSDEAAQAAEEKAKKIIAAYEALLAEHKNRN